MSNLFVISAPSGTGKTSLIRSLLKDNSSTGLTLGISYTTRKMRKNEVDKESYFFTSKEDFGDMIKKNQLLEHAEVFGNLYGTPKKWVYEQLEKGRNIILELDWQGANQVKKAYEEAITVFIIPPSYKSLKERLDKRDQDSEDEIRNRLAQAKKEIREGSTFDQLILNDDFNFALADMQAFITEGSSIDSKRIELISNCLEQLLEE
jgi:guanylate kinase